MISFQLKTSIAIALLFFIMGLSTSFLFDGCNQKVSANGSTIVQPKELKKQVESKDLEYQAGIAKLQTENRRLKQDLKQNALLLHKAKLSSKQKENKIRRSIQKGFSAKELLQKVKDTSKVVSRLSPCDSLIQEVNSYIEGNEIKDSLYEVHISTQESIITQKDSVIALSSKQNDDLKTSFNQSIDQQQVLLNERNLLKKKFKRQKLKQKIISVGLMIISGIGTKYLFNR